MSAQPSPAPASPPSSDIGPSTLDLVEAHRLAETCSERQLLAILVVEIRSLRRQADRLSEKVAGIKLPRWMG